ncbi:MAG TPA: rod shape-determining protein MreD [Gammaproteobacteria bacterium]|nr:rod shape-determining protein MreD [Gammaproteobacteria bacterium]
MSQQKERGNWVIVMSFVVALMLMALPMPDWAGIWRPAWVALVLIYWCMALPTRIGIMVAFTLGIFLDVLSGTLLGQNALALSVIAFITLQFYQRVRVLPLWQQGVTVFGLAFIHQVLILWINGIQGMPVSFSAYWASPLISMVLWPWIFVVLRDLRRKYQVV